VLGYNDEVGYFAMRLAVPKSRCLKGSSTPAYKGAWRGHRDGTGADTIWSPRLSPIECRVLQGNPPWACPRIRHKLLRPIPPWAFQQLGRPIGNPPYHLHGPPWLAGLGLRRRYYPFGISPTERVDVQSFKIIICFDPTSSLQRGRARL
jgi:hypothetical protein